MKQNKKFFCIVLYVLIGLIWLMAFHFLAFRLIYNTHVNGNIIIEDIFGFDRKSINKFYYLERFTEGQINFYLEKKRNNHAVFENPDLNYPIFLAAYHANELYVIFLSDEEEKGKVYKLNDSYKIEGPYEKSDMDFIDFKEPNELWRAL